MSETEQQIALSEWMGWKPTIGGLQPQGSTRAEWWLSPDGKTFRQLPNTNSLDVLHEMEKNLPINLQATFAHNLALRSERIDWLPRTGAQCFRLAHQSAPQRREALLRTIGLWKD